jgi:hypothetical protein
MAVVTSTLAQKPLFLEALSDDPEIQYTAAELRLLTGAIWSRSGIVTNTAMRVSQRAAGPAWAVAIGAGFVVLDGAGVDRYLLYQGSGLEIPLTGFDTTPAATRTHKVFVVVYDKLVQGAGYEAKVIITEDTGSGAPTPALNSPVSVLQLATITVSPGQGSIQDGHIHNTVRHAGFGGSHTIIALSDNIADASVTMELGQPRVIRSGTTAKLQGGVRRTSGNDFDAGATYILGRLDDAYRPNSTRYVIGTAGADLPAAKAYTYRLTIRTNGNLEADIPDGYTPNWLGLDGITYELD